MLSWDFTQQRACIVGDGSLFDDGITQLLTQKTNLLVSHAIFPDDLAFLKIIESDQPELILVCESGSLETARILDLVASHPKMRGLRIVVIRLNNLIIDIYPRPVFVAGKMRSRPRRMIARTEDDLLLDSCILA